MRMLLLGVLLVIVCSAVSGQNFNEWFRQKKTQMKYLKEQIVGLQAQIALVRQGYSIAKDGLDFISDVKNGDLNLHTNYFASLAVVSPVVRNYSKIAKMVTMQRDIIQLSRLHRGDDYTKAVFDQLLGGCTGVVDALIILTTAGKLEMKDDERIAAIDKLYADLQDKHAFANWFSGEVQLLSLQEQRESHDIKTTRALYGLQ